MFEVVVEYSLSGTDAEFGPFDSYESALEVAIDAMDEPDASYYIYRNGVLV